MNSFGLGIVLSFVDNASAGMNTATANFNKMSATADNLTSSVGASATEMAAIAYSLSAVGDTFMSIGESIMGVFSNITQSVISTGGEMMGYRMQLSALYGSVEAGEAKMEEIKQYAMSSVFEIQSLIPAVTTMKAVGIEALDEITTSSGSATQKLIDYASDLAAMMPNMRNVYGTGVNAAMGAFKEYIAEGNALSLKRGAGLDITAILGEEKGSTIEERTQQVADLIDKLNIVGYTANLAGTPTQRLSNMQDALFNSLSKIADSGVFEAYCGLLETLSDWVFSLVEDEETFNAITGVLAETVTTLLSPLQSMLDWIVANSDAIINWIKENPKLVKNILLTVAAVGALLIAGGSLLKLLSTISFAMSGLNVIKTLPALIGKLATAALPLVAVAGLAYAAWDSNLGGIKDKVTWFLQNMGDIFSVLGDAWGDNTLSEENFEKANKLGILPFIEGILQLKYYWDFFVEGFKKGFTSVFEGVIKVLKALGFEDLTEQLVEFLTRLTQPGAEDQWVAIGEAIGALVAMLAMLALVSKILTPIIKLFGFLGKAVKFVWNLFKTVGIWGIAVIKFFKDMGAAISLMKEGFGFFQVMGVWFPKLAAFFTKTGAIFAKIGGFFVKFGGLFAKLGGVFAKFGGWIVAGAKAIGAAIMGVLTAVAGFLGLPVWAVVAIIAAIVVVITLIIVFRKEIAQFFVWLWGKITEFCSWLGNAIANIAVVVWQAVSKFFSTVFKAIGDFFAKIAKAILSNPIVQSVINVMKSIFNVVWGVIKTIGTFFAGMGKVIWSVIKLIATYVVGVAKVIWSAISGAFTAIWAFIKGFAKFIATVAVGIWNVIKAVITFIVTFFKTAGEVIWKVIKAIGQFFRVIFLAILAVGKIIITGIVNFFKWLWSKVQPILQAIGNFFNKIFTWVRDNVIMPVVNWIVNAFNWVKDKITTMLTAIGDFFATIFNWINDHIITPFREFMGMVFDWIADKVDAVTSWISDAFDTVANWIKSVFQGVADFFTGIWDSICGGAKSFFDWIAEKLGWLTDGLSSIGSFFGGIADSVGGFFGNIGDSLASFVGLDTGGYVKTTGLAVLHPNEVVVNDDTTKRLQNFLGNYEEDNLSGLSNPQSPKAVLNNIYPTVMESVPVTTVPSPTGVVERAGDVHNDYSVTFASGSIVIQLLNATDAELEKAAEKIMKIIARKQQLRAMAVRT